MSGVGARCPRVRTPRGVALIVVLFAILLLATVTAAASSAARSSASVTIAVRAASVSKAMSESGVLAASTLVERALGRIGNDTSARARYLAEITSEGGEPFVADTLGDGAFSVVVVDVGARLDVNRAGREGWYLLLRAFTSDGEAGRAADAIDAWARGARPAPGSEDARALDALQSRDSLVAALLGRSAPPASGSDRVSAFETLDGLLEVPGIDAALLARVAPFLTVDGDGSVNRRSASPAVLAAASGSLVDTPTRLLIVSRGWMRGQPLTREIEAVYDLAPDGLRVVRWRERER